MKLFPYQTEGVSFLVTREDALLNWEPGCGKTPTAIAAWESIGAKDVIVLCPAVAKDNWAREIKRWGSPVRDILVLRGRSHPVPANQSGDMRVIIANYDLLVGESAVLRSLSRLTPDVLVLDEAHFLKNPTAARTKAVYGRRAGTGLAPNAKHVWALTGTPAPNHYGELYPMIRALFPEVITAPDGYLMSRQAFEDVYCKVAVTPWGRKISGSKNGRDLAAKLAPHMSSLKKKDVLADLPPLLFDVLPVSQDDIPEEHRAEAIAAYAALQEAAESNTEVDLLKALNSSNLALASARRAVGLAKVKTVAQLIKDELDADENAKRVIFAVHKSVVEGLTQALQEFHPAVLDGGTSTYERTRAVDRFQMDPTCRVFIGNITAAGTAITLTASNNVVFAESSWVPADNYQAACRCHRVGQRDAVLARMVCLSGTIDERVQTVVAAKTAELAELFG